jgi:hypothetical protein
MALPLAKPLDVIGVAPLGAALQGSVSTSLLKTRRLVTLLLRDGDAGDDGGAGNQLRTD